MTNRRTFVYGETRHKKNDDDEYSFEPRLSTVKQKQPMIDNLSASDYFVNSANRKSESLIPKKKVDLKEEIDFDSALYSSANEQNLQKKIEYIYVLRDDNHLNDQYPRKYVPSEKKAVDLSRTQSMEYLKPSEKTYFHELKFDKRLKRKPSQIRCEIEEPVLHEKPLPNRAVIRNGTIVYK